MTTLLYHHETNTVTTDGRETEGSTILTDSLKKFFTVERDSDLGNVYLILSGCQISIDYACHHYGEILPKSLRKDSPIGYHLLNGVITNLYYDSNGVMCLQTLNTDDSCGSGCVFALAGLDFGLTPYKAVKYAATRNIYTGGKVVTYNAFGVAL